MSYNKLSGSIQSEMKHMKQLGFLSLSDNMLTGSIPSWIGELKSLYYLTIDSNVFDVGTIPYGISYLSSLRAISLGNNQLIGTIPNWFGKLLNLTTIYLQNNQLTGAIPSTISNLTALIVIDIHNNQLTSTLPIWIGISLNKLKTLSVDGNLFTGIISSSLSKLTSLQALHLSNNLFIGHIPDIFHTMIHLEEIELDNNILSGTIPISFNKLSSLDRLFIQNNYLSGNLLTAFNGTYQQRLSNIQLSNNQFTGKLPEELFISTSLVSVSAVSNCFHGTIPHSICTNMQLETLALDGLGCASSCRRKIFPGLSASYMTSGSISGSIPTCILIMPKLQVLHLSGNSLTSTLPSTAINWTNSLRDLSLSFNLLKGHISTNIDLSIWTKADFSNNRFSGTISSFQFPSYNLALSLRNNRLSGYIPSDSMI